MSCYTEKVEETVHDLDWFYVGHKKRLFIWNLLDQKQPALMSVER